MRDSANLSPNNVCPEADSALLSTLVREASFEAVEGKLRPRKQVTMEYLALSDTSVSYALLSGSGAIAEDTNDYRDYSDTTSGGGLPQTAMFLRYNGEVVCMYPQEF